MNISTTLRLPWFSQLTGQFIFWLWMPLLGMNPLLILVTYKLVLLYQTWLHTEAIRKLPRFIEYIFNTPSHHRVHHSCNLEYLDKNHGAVLIIWDKLFGTFAEEKEKPRYGLTNQFNSANPFVINLVEWKTLFRKVVSAGSWKNGINYIIQPPGWSHDGNSKTVKQLRNKV